jgi:hypothetical protein
LYFADLPLDEALPFIKKIKNGVNKVLNRDQQIPLAKNIPHSIIVEEEEKQQYSSVVPNKLREIK